MTAAAPPVDRTLTPPTDLRLPLEPERERNAWAVLIVGSIVFAAVSTFMSFASTGFLEADGVTHYLYARFAFQNPSYFADVWGRPVRMLIHALPAHYFGLHGVRAASCVCALACAWLTYGIARRLGWRHAALAGCFVLAQPLMFLHSFSELTEIPFALLAAASFYALLSRRWIAFAVICGLMPAARPEGAAFMLLAVVVLALHRRWYALPLVFLPILLWNHIGWTMWGGSAGPWWRWLIDRFPYSEQSMYGSGSIFHFLGVLPFVVSPFILPAVLLGTIGVVRDRVADEAASVARWITDRETWLIAAIPWGILCFHSVLYATGKMSSSGEPRYLLSVAPFWALLGCRGWSMLEARFHWRQPLAWAVVAAIVPCFGNLAWRVVPVRQQPDAILCQRLGNWYRASSLETRYPKVYATHPLMYFTLDRMVQNVDADLAAHPPAGAIFFYDSMYASFNSDPRHKVTPELFEQGGWTEIPLQGYTLPTQTWKVFVSPQPAPAR